LRKLCDGLGREYNSICALVRDKTHAAPRVFPGGWIGWVLFAFAGHSPAFVLTVQDYFPRYIFTAMCSIAPKSCSESVSFRMTLVTLPTHKGAMSQESREMKPSQCARKRKERQLCAKSDMEDDTRHGTRRRHDQKETNPFDHLPVEITNMILDRIDATTRPIARRVCGTWRALLCPRTGRNGVPCCGNGCGMRKRCAQYYASRVIHERRWVVLDWMLNDCAGQIADMEHVACLESTTAASDGNWARLRPLIKGRGRSYIHDAIEAAALHGQKRTMRKLLCALRSKGTPFWLASRAAARGGHLGILRWLAGQGHDLVDTLDVAAEYGHVDIVRWLWDGKGCRGDRRACEGAARRGHLDVIKWMHARGCAIDYGAVCREAAERGHLAIAEWAYAHGGRLYGATLWMAARNGHLDILVWAHARRHDAMHNGANNGQGNDLNVITRNTTMQAAQGGHVHVLEWFEAQGWSCDESVCTNAAQYGHLDVLQWARARGCPWNNNVYKAAVRGGHLHIIQWAHQHGCLLPRSKRDFRECCREAAFYGHVAVLAWLLDHGASWSKGIAKDAATGGHPCIFRWADSRGHPWRTPHACWGAAKANRTDMLWWLRENGCPWDEETCGRAAKHGNLATLKWLRKHGCPWNKWTCIYAAMWGHLEILQWARSKGCPWSKRVRREAEDHEYDDILRWAIDNGCPS